MRLGLIFAGEVEVNIGYLIALNAEEGGKGDVKALLFHLHAAVRAELVRHIRAAAVALAGLKIRAVAFRAKIVRREGVHLRYAGEIGDERGADAATASDKIAVRVGVGHQLLRRHIDNVKVAREYRVHFKLHTVGDELFRVLAI